MRGMVPRIHRNIDAISRVKVDWVWSIIILFRGSWKKNTVVSRLIIIILVYSAIKIRANVPLLYSMLNPETSSDSPSAKSKGVRLVSARVVVNQHKDRTGKRITGGTMLWWLI